MRLLLGLFLLAFGVANAAPTRIACQYFLNGESGPYAMTHVFDVDAEGQKISRSSKQLTVSLWSDANIRAEEAEDSIDTVPRLTRYSIFWFDRLSGGVSMLGIWRAPDGRIFRGPDLEAVAGKHPLWNVPLPGGIYEPRTLKGECRPLSQKF